MSLLVLFAGGPTATPPTDLLSGTVKASEDVALWLVSPNRQARYPVVDYLDIELTQGPQLQDVLTVTLPRASIACTQSYSGATALANRFEGWSFDLQVRGSLEFFGPRQRFRFSWAGKRRTSSAGTLHDPTAKVVVTCEHFYTRLTRDRKVYGTGSGTSTGAKFLMTDNARNIALKLVSENMVAGTVLEPPDWDTGGLDRALFGPGGAWSVTTGTASGTGTMTFGADFGDNLHDTLTELGDTPKDDADKLWPVCTETSAGVFNIDFQVGRAGAGRGIGYDRTGIIVSPEAGNLAAYDVDEDGAQAGSHFQAAGNGRGAGQRRRYKSDSAALAYHGLSEDSITIPGGTTNAELDNEAQRQINAKASGSVTHVLTIIEQPNFQWPYHFGIKDTLTVYTPLGDANTVSPSAAQMLQLLIIGVNWKKSGAKPPELRLVFGRWPTNESRQQGRSGGGGSGGRGGGGRPRSKAGDPTSDPDAHLSYGYVITNHGNTEAGGVNRYLKLTNYDNSPLVRVDTWPTDSALDDNAGSPDVAAFRVHATFVDALHEVPNGSIVFMLDDGQYFYVDGYLTATAPGAP